MNQISHEIDFKNILLKESEKRKISLDKKLLERFELYKNLLLKWNEKINLTAITDDFDIIMKHFVDCLEVTKYINRNSKIIDIGTGAGLPGLVISIFFDDNIKVTLVDSLNKRINFLNEVVKSLDLKNISIIHGRAEELGNKEEYREKYDYVVSRAVAPLNVLSEYDSPFLKVNGKALFLKGNRVKDEIDISKKAFEILKLKIKNIYNYNYTVNVEEYSRSIVEIIKINHTPKKYPRNYGKIKKCPL